MSENRSLPDSIMSSLIQASVGSRANYRIAFFGQAIFGFLYSFGYFELKLAGLVIGFVMPVIWVISTYRLLKEKAGDHEDLPFPRWLKNEPGNSLVIAMDIVFLSLIWFFILSGLYEATWIKVLFTIFFPLLTLAMLNNLYHYPPEPPA